MDDALIEPVELSVRDINIVEECVGVPVCVFEEEIVRVPLTQAVAVRVPASVRVSVILSFVVGETVRVAVGVLEGGELRLSVAVALPVLLGNIDRVGEDEPLDVLLSGPDRVDDGVIASVEEGLFVLVEQAVAVGVLDFAVDDDKLAEPVDVLEPA